MKNKILENGTLVYNKNHGQGLIWCYKPNMAVYEIIFEGHKNLVFLSRESLFVKGDKVLVISKRKQHPFYNDDEVVVFIGFDPYQSLNKFLISSSISSYVYDVQQVEKEDTIEITVKVNGKEVPLNTLSMDTLEKIRATENNHE